MPITTYKLAGKVTHFGLPATGVTVALMRNGTEGAEEISSTTSTKGEYQFAVEPATYKLVVKPSESTSFVRQEFAEVAVFTNTVFNVSLTTGFVLRGKVASKSGAKFGPCLVVVEEADSNLLSFTQAIDAGGCFSFVLPRGQYNLYLRSASDSNVFIANSFNAVELTGDQDVTITVPDMVEFSGHIVDLNDKPQPETKVTISPSQKHRYLPQSENACATSCLSNANGDFKLQIEPGSYDFSFQPAEFSPLTEHKEESVVVSRDLKRTYVLAFGFRLSGTVSYEGKSVNDCLIEVCAQASSKPSLPSLIACNQEGFFSCGLTEGTYNVKVLPAKTGHQSFVPWTRELTVTADIDLDVELLSGTEIAGIVADGEGKALSLVPISIYVNGANLFRDTTDAEGKYSFALSPGNYQIGINDDLSLAESIEVGNQAVVHNVCWDSACLVRFKVVSEEDDVAVSSCKVSWEPYSPHDTQGQAKLLDINHGVRLGSTYTDGEGICQMTLPNGLYSFHFDPPEQSTSVHRVIRQLSIAGEFKRKVKLSPKDHI